MTQVVYKRSYPETSRICSLSSSEEEDCAHLFFQMPLHQDDMERHTIPRVDTTLEISFSDSIQKIDGKRREEEVRIFTVLWVTWLHRNDKIFNGRATST